MPPETLSGSAPALHRRPYPGLRAFARDESDLFFGRDEQVDQLLDKLAETRFLAVIGTSGSGKSSLVRAGLLPALASGVLTRPAVAGPAPGTRWSIAELRPGEHPFRGLAEALTGQTGWGGDVGLEGGQDARAPREALESALRRGPRALPWLLGLHPLPSGERLLILVDQFEELFRYRRDRPADAEAFAALLLGAAVHPDCFVVITLRSEFLGECARFPGLPEAINAGLYLTPRLTPEQLADAVQLPARLPGFGGDLTPGLVHRLLREASGEQDQLPLVQHLLMRLWDRTAPGPDGTRLLDEAGYASLGGLQGALDGDAEEALAELTGPGQTAVAEVMFRTLTDRADGEHDTRRPVLVREVAAVAGVDPAVVIAGAAPFRRADRSFLMPPPDWPLGPDDQLDITHEALIRQWRRLQGWTADEAQRTELYRRLESAARRWREGRGALWIDPDLTIGLDWRDRTGPTPAWADRYGGDLELALAFLEAGRAARDQAREEEERRRRAEVRRARTIAFASVVALTVTLALAGWVALERGNAQARATEAQAEKHARTESLFESKLTHAALMAKGEDYAGAWRTLGETLPLDGDGIAPARREVRNLLAGMVDLRRGTADRVYTGAGASLIDVALSPDGRWLVAGGERGTLVVFDAESGELVRRLEGHDPGVGKPSSVGSIKGVSFDPAGSRLYTGGADRRIIAWSVPDWREVRRWEAPGEVWSLAPSPDGQRLASRSRDADITLWSTETGKPIRTLKGETSNTADGSALAWLSDGRLVSGGYGGLVGIWETGSGKEQVLPRVHTDRVNSVAVSPDGTRIASGSADQTICLWDAEGRPIRRLRGHRNGILGLAFDPSGRRLLSASYDNDLRLWDLDSGTTLRVFQGHTAGLWSVVAAGGLAYTAANDGTLRRWTLDRPGQWVWDLSGLKPFSVSLDPDSGLALLGLTGGALRAYGLPGTPADPRAPTPAAGAAPSEAPGRPAAEPDPDRPGPLLAEFPDAHRRDINRISWSPDHRTFATAGMDAVARLWRPERGAAGLTLVPLHRLTGHTDAVYAVAFSPDGRQVATAGFDGQVGLFDSQTGTGTLSRAAETGRVASVAFTPDGRQLLTAQYEDRTLRLWTLDGPRLGTGRTIATLPDWPMWAALSPDGREAAAVGRQMFVTRHPLASPPDGALPTAPAPLVGHEQAVFRAIYAPNGQSLATVDGDTTLRLWDLATDQPLFRLQLPTPFLNRPALWDFDLACTTDRTACWLAVPLTMGRLALYRLPYAEPPPGLAPP